MNELIELAKYILPTVVLCLAVLLILNHFSKREKTKLKFDLIKSNNKVITPIKLQAYERVIIFLERIRPDALALRLTKPGMTAKQIQMEMLLTVRNEFNHNLSQQLYLSEESWSAVVYAKEQITRMINLTGTKVAPKNISQAFTSVFIEIYNDAETKPVETSVNMLKKEAAQFFGM